MKKTTKKMLAIAIIAGIAATTIVGCNNHSSTHRTEEEPALIRTGYIDDEIVPQIFGKADQSQAEASKVESSQAEVSKVESSQAEASKVESSQAEVSKVESSQAEVSKVESSQAEVSKVESSQAEVSKVEPSQAEASKVESSQAEASKVESSQAEPSKINDTQVLTIDCIILGDKMIPPGVKLNCTTDGIIYEGKLYPWDEIDMDAIVA